MSTNHSPQQDTWKLEESSVQQPLSCSSHLRASGQFDSIFSLCQSPHWPPGKTHTCEFHRSLPFGAIETARSSRSQPLAVKSGSHTSSAGQAGSVDMFFVWYLIFGSSGWHAKPPMRQIEAYRRCASARNWNGPSARAEDRWRAVAQLNWKKG